MQRSVWCAGLCLVLLLAGTVRAQNDGVAAVPTAAKSYAELLAQDEPAALWRFDSRESHPTTLIGSVQRDVPGPQPESFGLFEKGNTAIQFTGRKGYLQVDRFEDASVFDFTNGDAITLEAWVNPDSVAADQQIYIIGKGRTNNSDFARDNQNWSLRLRGVGGSARASFLFRGAKNRPGNDKDWHRWTSRDGFVPDGLWHHVALVYEFGSPQSIRAYVDGRETDGTWDMGGATTEAPVVDKDAVWIGSSMGGTAGTFKGQIDELALYRKALPADRLRLRYQPVPVNTREAELAAFDDVPADAVLIELHEGIPSEDSWAFKLPAATTKWTQPAFAFVGFPKRYTSSGVIGDRTNPLLLRARGRLVVPEKLVGSVELLLRAKGGARVFLDGKPVLSTDFMNRNASGHEAVPEVLGADSEDLRPLPPGCQEQVVLVELGPGEHLVRLEAFVGGKGLRLELDEVCVGVRFVGQTWQLVAPRESLALTDEAWQSHTESLRHQLFEIDRATRIATATEWAKYWDRRHEFARRTLGREEPVDLPALVDVPGANNLDRWLAADGAQPRPAVEDLTFLRRLTLDLVGLVPSREEIARFLADPTESRRDQAIERLLADPRTADHGVPYWQDVLAENPGILKPELNNTGPFRWWIYESLLDNKPVDRFATELALMEGSTYYGGPAGFGLATQNDAPLAAKAHVLARTFLAIDLTCARCHDAPFHPYKQQELFSLAALLNRKELALPKTSTVPPNPGGRVPAVTVSLQPGDVLKPVWPFADVGGEIPAELLRNPDDLREQFAFRLTSPHNARFAPVFSNRLWQRLMGRALIDPVDDWDGDLLAATHPKTLKYLAEELIDNNYDALKLTRLIVSSRAYQAEAGEGSLIARKRLTAEQLADSLLALSGKTYAAEPLTMDPEGRRPVDSFLNLGTPTRAWHFTSLSNERDRPALALPVSQSVVDLLLAFGWRDSRQFPLTIREDALTPLQPLSLANGLLANRAIRLSDDNVFTTLALRDQPLETLIEDVFLRTLSRRPTPDEHASFATLLAEGFSDRQVPGATILKPKKSRHAVSWSNHLSAEATRIKQDLERALLAGDQPTARLKSDWRERMEDAVWALVNSPEFAFVP